MKSTPGRHITHIYNPEKPSMRGPKNQNFERGVEVGLRAAQLICPWEIEKGVPELVVKSIGRSNLGSTQREAKSWNGYAPD